MKYLLLATGLLSISLSSFASTERKLSWDNLMWQQVYQHQDSISIEDNIDALMQTFKSSVWDRYENDEFELDDKRQASIQEFTARLPSYKEISRMTLRTRWEFDKYDFKSETLPVKGITKDSYFPIERHTSKLPVSRNLPSDYKLSFTNPDLAGDIKLAKAEAKKLIMSRKDSSGWVDREISVELVFDVIDISSDWGKRAKPDVKATLVSVVYKDHDGTVLQSYSK